MLMVFNILHFGSLRMSDERLKRAKPPPEPGPPYIAAAAKSEISHSLSENPRLLKLKFRPLDHFIFLVNQS